MKELLKVPHKARRNTEWNQQTSEHMQEETKLFLLFNMILQGKRLPVLFDFVLCFC